MPDEQRLEDTERAFTAIWSRFCGAWSRGELHERAGLTWFATPIRHLPYNGVIRTRMDALDVGPEQVVQAGDGCLSPEGLVSSVMVVAPEPAVKGCGAFSA